MRDSLENEWKFLLKIYKHVTPSQNDMSTQKATANETTESLAFTACKVELRGKAIVLDHDLGAHVLDLWSTIIGKTEEKRGRGTK